MSPWVPPSKRDGAKEANSAQTGLLDGCKGCETMASMSLRSLGQALDMQVHTVTVPAGLLRLAFSDMNAEVKAPMAPRSALSA